MRAERFLRHGLGINRLETELMKKTTYEKEVGRELRRRKRRIARALKALREEGYPLPRVFELPPIVFTDDGPVQLLATAVD